MDIELAVGRETWWVCWEALQSIKEQEVFVVVVAFPEQMNTDVLSHGRKRLQIWRQFFYDGQGSEGFWLIKGSSYYSPSLRRGSIKKEMQPK